jgi:uncharacterized protein YbjT (DUF2867 family)
MAEVCHTGVNLHLLQRAIFAATFGAKSEETSMILVTGATGANGSEIVKQLAAAGVPCRAMVRNPDKATELRLPGVEIVRGDFAEAASLDAALRGVNHAVLLSTFDPQQVELQGNFIQAAQRAKVEHVVKLSALGANPNSKIMVGKWHGQIEQQLEKSGLGWTMLQPSFFMQNMRMFADSIAQQGAFACPAGDGQMGMVDVRDIAAVAVKALTEPGHMGKKYVVTGPEAISYGQIAEKLSAATGKSVQYVNVTPDDAKKNMLGMGLPAWFVDAMLELYGVVRGGYGAVVTKVVEQVTGQKPRNFEAFAREHARMFRG